MALDSQFAARVRVFEKYARAMPPHVADLIRRCAADADILSLIPAEPNWDAPHRLTAALDWLIDIGMVDDYRSSADPWRAFRTAAFAHADHVRTFVRDQPVQTNEVQRCFALLPIFLALAGRTRKPLDLLELGASAGLNLLVDRYRYRYGVGTWGPAGSPLELSGEERRSVPRQLLDQRLRIVRRRGIDLNPLDVRNDDHVRMLRIFAASHRRPRLERAIAVARSDPPEVMRGDYLHLLPTLLADRSPEALTVVFQTLSTVYLTDAQRAQLRRIMDEAGGTGPLAYIGTPTPEERGERLGDYPIELTVWPAPQRSIVARMENHGEWLDWIG